MNTVEMTTETWTGMVGDVLYQVFERKTLLVFHVITLTISCVSN